MNEIRYHHALLFMLFCLMVAATLRIPDLAYLAPGLHYDEAANATLVAEIAFDGYRPLFITSYTGKEVLFLYLAAGVTNLVGSSIFTLRLTAVFVSLLTIAATYWAGMELCRDRRIALLAVTLLTVSFWHLLFSRIGFRVNTQPLFQALVVASLLRGYRLNARPWLFAAGFFLGLAAYTYLAVRLFPVLLIIALLPLLLKRLDWLVRWQQTAVVGLTAFLVSAPLLHYFWQHPDTFWVRISQVAPGQTGLTLPESLAKSFAMFFLQGDPYIRFNLPERPLFDWFWGGLLLAGWLMLISRWRKLEIDWQKTSALLLIFAPLIMILPTALATNEIVPSNIRAFGLIPFIFYLPAIGLVGLIDDLNRQFQWPHPTTATAVVAIFLLMSNSLYVERLYFREWGTRADLFYETDGDLTVAARFLNQLNTDGQQIYIAAEHYRHPTIAYLSPKYGQVKWLPQSQAVVFPAEQTAVYIFPHNSPMPTWATPYFAEATTLRHHTRVDGEHPFSAYRLSQTPTLTITHPLDVNFGDAISLIGYDILPVSNNSQLPITLYWRVLQSGTGHFQPFVHLEDTWEHRWSQIETFSYPSEQWTAGETIVQRVQVPLPPGLPPDTYQLRVGLFSPESGSQLPRLDAHGRYAGNAALLENIPIQLTGLPNQLPYPPFVLEQEIRPYLRLLGFERGGLEVATGEPYGLAFWWLATRAQPKTTTELMLLRPGGTKYSLGQTEPVHNNYPFSEWQPPQFIIDRQTITIPVDVPADTYQLAARFIDESGKTIEIINLGGLIVQAQQRNFTPPKIETAVNATFGNEIELLGYNLNHTNEANRYSLSLVWQAKQAPTTSYTVFVHLLQPDGRCCVWQQDLLPQQGQYPTDRWLADEIIIDSYEIELTPDVLAATYPLEIGLYVAQDGRRLQIDTPTGQSSDALFLEPLSYQPN